MIVKSIVLLNNRYNYFEVVYMYFQRLKDLRNDKDLMQKEIADILNIDQRVYSNYETGKREIPCHLVIKLAKFYNVSSDYILGITNNPNPYNKNSK